MSERMDDMGAIIEVLYRILERLDEICAALGVAREEE